MKIYTADGQVLEGSLFIGDVELPVVDGEVQLFDTPFTRAVAASEWDLIRRYDRGEFDDPS